MSSEIATNSTSALFSPETDANRELRRNVAPADWENPKPEGKYNLVVIGAGSGGLITAAGAAGLGARVALIERQALGGDCLNVGCVPSKSLLAAAKQVAAFRHASDFGIEAKGSLKVDFSAIMERMRRMRAKISPNDSVERFTELGIDVYLGDARFTGPETVEVDGRELAFSKAVVATGARAIVLPIPGLKEAHPLTNETIFSLTELPTRLAIIGAGPIGCEMAQAFSRFGSEVTLFETECRILPRDDAEAAAVVESEFEAEGIQRICEAEILKVESEEGRKRIVFKRRGERDARDFDQILLGVGRAPNVERMGLEEAGVEFDKQKGVKVNDHLRTSNPRIYAVGDVCLPYKFTHVADASARIAIQNTLFMGRKKHTDLLVPWCTYTDPELAHVGMNEEQAKKKYGDKVQAFRQDFAEVDRSILEGRAQGFVKLWAVKGRIVGATIVGVGAGELISEVSVAMRSGMKLGELASVIHPYPTTAEAIRKTGDAFQRTRISPFLEKAFAKWLSWSR